MVTRQHRLILLPRAFYLGMLGLLSCGGRASDGGSHPDNLSGTAGTSSRSAGGASDVAVGGATAGTSTASGGTPSVTTAASEGGRCQQYADLAAAPNSQFYQCSSSTIVLESYRASILFVLDRSLSMAAVPSGYGVSKWQAVSNALGKILEPSDRHFSYGLLTFPSAQAAHDCDVSADVSVGIAEANNAVPAIENLLSVSVPRGDTPMALALSRANAHVIASSFGALDFPRQVVLVADGGPNCNADATCSASNCTSNIEGTCPFGIANCCNPGQEASSSSTVGNVRCLDTQPVVAQVEALRNVGVGTFVIGLPGTEPYADFFDTLAAAGGFPVEGSVRKYYEARTEADLEGHLRRIVAMMTPLCEVPMEERPMDLNQIYPAIDCTLVPQSTNGSANWVYDAVTASVRFLGAYCEMIQSGAVERLDVALGCAVGLPW